MQDIVSGLSSRDPCSTSPRWTRNRPVITVRFGRSVPAGAPLDHGKRPDYVVLHGRQGTTAPRPHAPAGDHGWRRIAARSMGSLRDHSATDASAVSDRSRSTQRRQREDRRRPATGVRARAWEDRVSNEKQLSASYSGVETSRIWPRRCGQAPTTPGVFGRRNRSSSVSLSTTRDRSHTRRSSRSSNSWFPVQPRPSWAISGSSPTIAGQWSGMKAKRREDSSRVNSTTVTVVRRWGSSSHCSGSSSRGTPSTKMSHGREALLPALTSWRWLRSSSRANEAIRNRPRRPRALK
jgi:hypothetical protein